MLVYLTVLKDAMVVKSSFIPEPQAGYKDARA
jgi:hypothetical protein